MLGRKRIVTGALCLAVLFTLVLGAVPGQSQNSNVLEDSTPQVANQQGAALLERVAKLEERVAWLENQVGQLCAEDATLAKINAEHKLAIAEERLSQSERLAVHGYISNAQLQADRLAVEIAKRELQLASDSQKTDAEAAHLAVLNAEAALSQAQLRLDHSERLLGKGYVSSAEVAQDRAGVDRAKKVLDAAKLKLQMLTPENEDSESSSGNANDQ